VERKLRYVWWLVLAGLVIVAIWKLFLPHGTNAYVQTTVSSREIVVYVAGAVEKPGLVHLAADARVDDALKQACPLLEANLEVMNPAEKLKDGQKINVPYKPILVSPESTGAGNPGVSGNVSTAPDLSSTPVVKLPVQSSGKININTAGATELDKLSGVGPALAERIIQYRTEHGPFAQPEDLKDVSGIGDKTYDKMASQVSVSP